MKKAAVLILLFWPWPVLALSLTLSWNQNPPGDAVTDYIVYMGFGPGVENKREVARTQARNVITFNPVECQLPITLQTPQLCFWVTAVNKHGESGFSDPACIHLLETDFTARGWPCGPASPTGFDLKFGLWQHFY